jgi:hypothetical protein
MDQEASLGPIAEDLESITIRYSRTGQDYVAANLAYLKANGWLKVIAIFIGVFLLATFGRLVPIFFDGFQLWDYTLLGGFLLVILVILIAFFVNPFIVGNRLNKQNLWIAETICTASEQEIRFESEFGDDRVNWESYWKVIESGDAFLLLMNANKQMMQIIPKRGFSSSADELAFRELLKHKIKLWAVARTTPQRLLPRLSNRGIIAIVVVGIFILLIVLSNSLQTSGK